MDIEQIKKNISVETLTIMQLIGFNYKQAIGEPLTLLLKKTIESKLQRDSSLNITMVTLAQDKEATNRYYQLTGQKNVSEEELK